MPDSANLEQPPAEFARKQSQPITDLALLERMKSEATQWINAVHMQARRIADP